MLYLLFFIFQYHIFYLRRGNFVYMATETTPSSVFIYTTSVYQKLQSPYRRCESSNNVLNECFTPPIWNVNLLSNVVSQLWYIALIYIFPRFYYRVLWWKMRSARGVIRLNAAFIKWTVLKSRQTPSTFIASSFTKTSFELIITYTSHIKDKK